LVWGVFYIRGTFHGASGLSIEGQLDFWHYLKDYQKLRGFRLLQLGNEAVFKLSFAVIFVCFKLDLHIQF
jgi:hypothetical protein